MKRYRKILWAAIFLMAIGVGTIFAYRQNIIAHKSYNNSDFGIQDYQSQIDQDGDGVDDQTDILENARAYIVAHPKYKSKYYDTGYPDDEYGVCTDLVAIGLRDAGYDLMESVNADIVNNQDAYGLETVDKNIDFRRVQNLKVYCKRNLISLTTDINDIAAWQGGDIVIFEKHIAIVSDKRNRDGVPFVIHHRSPFQLRYEEDILEYRSDIVGHYRVS